MTKSEKVEPSIYSEGWWVVGEKGQGMQRESESELDVLQRGVTKSKQELYSCWSNRRAGPHPHSIFILPLVFVDVQSINVKKE